MMKIEINNDIEISLSNFRKIARKARDSGYAGSRFYVQTKPEMVDLVKRLVGFSKKEDLPISIQDSIPENCFGMIETFCFVTP